MKVSENDSKNKRGKPVANHPVSWTSTHQSVLEELIECLVSAPVMAYPDPHTPYVLHTDASENGLGAVLYQEQDDVLRVIAYGSRTLTPAEKNYHLHSGKLEFLALKWAICEQFRDYLYYSPSFVVYTDNNPLTYVLSTAKLNATGFRWIGELADFNFTIRYRPGKMNTDADTLSRLLENMSEYMDSCTAETCLDELRAIVQSIQLEDKGKVTWVSSLTHDPTVLHGGDPQQIASSTPQFNISTFEKLSLKIMLLEKFIRLSTENSDQLPLREQQNHPILNSYFMNGQSCLLIKTAFYEDRTTHTIRLCFLDHTIEQFYVNFTTTWLILDLSASYAWLEIGSTGLGCRVMWSTTCIISVAVLSKDHQD